VPLDRATAGAPQGGFPQVQVEELQAAGAPEPLGAQEAAAPEQRRQEILSALTRLRRGLEAPAGLFSLLKEELGLTHSALLLYDPLRMVFAPWAACGYDPTTLQRLRIPLGYNDSFTRLASGETLRLSQETDLAQLRTLFSFRQFSSLDYAVLVPFVHAGKWVALLLITGQEASGAERDPDLYAGIAERAAELLYEARERHLEALNHDERHLEAVRHELLARPDQLVQLVTRSAEAATEGDRPLLAIRLDLRGVFAAVLHAAPALDPFRLREDLAGVLLAVASSVGTATLLGSEHLLLLIHGIEPEDPELLLRHLEGVLRQYFPTLAELPELGLHPEIRSWNGPPEQAEQILESFD
jgi:hypothetical protein